MSPKGEAGAVNREVGAWLCWEGAALVSVRGKSIPGRGTATAQAPVLRGWGRRGAQSE